jgi:hypothetical protein
VPAAQPPSTSDTPPGTAGAARIFCSAPTFPSQARARTSRREPEYVILPSAAETTRRPGTGPRLPAMPKRTSPWVTSASTARVCLAERKSAVNPCAAGLNSTCDSPLTSTLASRSPEAWS